MDETGEAAGAGGAGAADEGTETSSATGQESGPVTSGNGEAPATDLGGEGGGGRSKAAAVAAGTGAAVAGIAGGIAVAARDTRRRILGVPLGKRNRFQRAAGTVVDKVQEPARKLGSRFSRDKPE